jgi:hypothetical protein
VHGVTDLEFFFRAYSKLLVKVDVEGFEPELLRALQDTVSAFVLISSSRFLRAHLRESRRYLGSQPTSVTCLRPPDYSCIPS